MKRFYDSTLIEAYLKQTRFESAISSLREYLFVTQYKKGEFIATPLQKENLFQIIIRGTVNIYFMMGRYILLQMLERMIYSAKWKFSHIS